MQITKIYCDKCKKEIEESTVFQGKDLCQCCTDKAVKIILAWIEGKSEGDTETFSEHYGSKGESEKTVQIECKKEALTEKPKKIKPIEKAKDDNNSKVQQAKKIDWNKACALKLSGWKNSAIAEEVGTTPGTIDACIYKKLVQYKIERGLK